MEGRGPSRLTHAIKPCLLKHRDASNSRAVPTYHGWWKLGGWVGKRIMVDVFLGNV